MINVSKLYCNLAGSSDSLRYSTDNSLTPVAVFNCTNRCNLKCLHCYSSSVNASSESELTTQQAFALLSQLAEINCPAVLFSGGEPLLREDLFDLFELADSKGLRTVLSSNGTLIDEQTAERLAEAKVSYVGISIDGDEKFHDNFRQVNGCFDAAMKGIENCLKADIRTGLRFTITKQNAEYVPYIFDLAASLGIRRICFYHLIRAGRAKLLENQQPSIQQTRQIVDIIIEKTKQFVQKALVDEVLTVGNHCDGPYLLLRMVNETKNSKLKTKNFAKAKELLRVNRGNRIGEKLVCIGPDGSVYPDQFWRNYALGNIKNTPFKKIWQNPDEPVLKKLRNKARFADRKCLKCKWFNLCKGNYRFLTTDPAEKNWLNEPACYLTDKEIRNS